MHSFLTEVTAHDQSAFHIFFHKVSSHEDVKVFAYVKTTKHVSCRQVLEACGSVAVALHDVIRTHGVMSWLGS
jgi:hypothetical protein